MVKDKNIYKTNNQNKKIDFLLKMEKQDYVKNITKFVKYTLKCLKIKNILCYFHQLLASETSDNL